ncbi:MAG: hypothetical protein KatS3mg012_0632 [Gaiellaceae bacterium]|nr:MAG: hypothetical protein KatS3mg012_0632 [Gaiellaceae bacterium]
MVASMIGLGPHEMTPWLWAYSVGLVVFFAALAAASIYVALRVTADSPREATSPRTNPYPVPVVRTDALTGVSGNDRNPTR